MHQASLNIGVLHLATTSLSVLASHSMHRQTQSGKVRLKNFHFCLSFELAGVGLLTFIIFPLMYDDIVKTGILMQR